MSCRARGGIPGARVVQLNPGAGLIECHQREHSLGSTREFDGDGNLTVPGGVEDGVDTVGSEGSNPLAEPVTIESRRGPEGFEVLLIGRARGADHAHTAGRRELSGDRANAAGGGVNE